MTDTKEPTAEATRVLDPGTGQWHAIGDLWRWDREYARVTAVAPAEPERGIDARIAIGHDRIAHVGWWIGQGWDRVDSVTAEMHEENVSLRAQIATLTRERDEAREARDQANEDASALADEATRARAERDEVRKVAEESEHAMHMRIRAGYDSTIADSWRARLAEVERERDDARQERDDARAERDSWHASVAHIGQALGMTRDDWRDVTGPEVVAFAERVVRERDEATKLADESELRDAAAAIDAASWACWNGYGPVGDGRMRMARIGPAEEYRAAGDTYVNTSIAHPDGPAHDIAATRETAEALVLLVRSVPALLDTIASLRAQIATLTRERDEARDDGIRAMQRETHALLVKVHAHYAADLSAARLALRALLDAHASSSDAVRIEGAKRAMALCGEWGV